MAEEKTPPADKADDAPEQEPAAAPPLDGATGDDKESDAAFDAAFDEFAAADNTETAAPPAEGQEDEGQPADAAAEKTEDDTAPGEKSPGDASDQAAPDGAAVPEDIWADATPAQIAAFEAASHENESHRTRASAQNRKITELMTAAPTPAAKPAADPEAEAAAAAATKTDENWEQFKTEYPEVAAPMEERFDARLAKLETENAELRGRVTGITDVQTQDAIDHEEAMLLQRHPDYVAATETPEFADWVTKQPRYVQEGFARNGQVIVDGQEAASLLDLYTGASSAPSKSEEPVKAPADGNSGKATRRQRRLESAVQTESGQAGPGAGPPEGDFDAAFDHFARLP